MQIVVTDRAELARIFAARVETHAHRTQRCSLALPGGSAAETFCPALAAASVDWSRVDVFWCDERAVPPDHVDSNFRIAEELLLRRVPIDRSRVHRMPGESPDLARAAAEYEADLQRTLGDPPRLDLALLGVGPDGHVCSLFPGHPALDEAVRRTIAIDDSPKPPPRRLTLTLPALKDSFVVVAAFGRSKAAVIKEALHERGSSLPLARAVRGARDVLFLLDEEAGIGVRLTTD
jgi:6-phosphogluconolactonase